MTAPPDAETIAAARTGCRRAVSFALCWLDVDVDTDTEFLDVLAEIEADPYPGAHDSALMGMARALETITHVLGQHIDDTHGPGTADQLTRDALRTLLATATLAELG